MKKELLSIAGLMLVVFCTAQPALKFVVYDFDGQDIGETDLPDGDYRNNDLTYHAVSTPFATSDVLGDRVLQMDLNWSLGNGEFGKNLSRFVELDPATDKLNFYFYNPTTNAGPAKVQVTLTEDDNSNNTYEFLSDDKWIDDITIPIAPGWQLISLPLNNFTDGNPGGNGIFDVGYAGSGSMLFSVGFVFTPSGPTSGTEHYYMDMICFTEGALPYGTTILDLPGNDPGDHCVLGALQNNTHPETTPDTIEALFATHQLRYVNWFLDYSSGGTTANVFPGAEVQTLISEGYRPVITWEMMFQGYSRLDPIQPRLNKILDGTFDTYIDAFADQVRSYSDTVILRIFHEFEGDWYPWSLTENGHDPAVYIAAYHHVVDRFRARGTNNVHWMWCVNAEPKPYVDYNCLVNAYPGDSYVDIVATDIYNHPDIGTPAWKSFRYTLAESYYSLTKHFPNKPFYICEVACRERNSGEVSDSQIKADWVCAMEKELRSYFSKTRALIFFSMLKEHDWRINSSPAALTAINDCIWSNNYYVNPDAIKSNEIASSLNVYPNPFSSELNIDIDLPAVADKGYELTITDLLGKKIFSEHSYSKHTSINPGIAPGIYIVEIRNNAFSEQLKLIRTLR